MTLAHKKSPPGQAAVIEGKATQSVFIPEQRNTSVVLAGDALRECPAELFPGFANAIRKAKTIDALGYAIARYAYCAMWARHSTGRGADLAREVVTNTILLHARKSPMRHCVTVRFIAHIVARMDEAAREAVEGRDA